MQAEIGAAIHNRFDVEVRDARTGELKQSAHALNIVLNQMWTRLCNGTSYFGNIHFGTGSGTLSAARTTLFSWLGQKVATTEEAVRALPTSSWKRKIVLAPEEYVGSTITEVGIGYDSGAASLVTHAMLKDSEGNPVSITKTALDVVTIYATVFSTFSTPDSKVKLIGLPTSNYLVNYLAAGGSAPAGVFSLGDVGYEGSEFAPGSVLGISLGDTAMATWTADVANKKRSTAAMRFGTAVGNGHAAEFGFAGTWRATFPLPAVVSGNSYSGVPIGTGDGSTDEFTLPSNNVDRPTIVTKVNGTVVPHVATAVPVGSTGLAFRTKAIARHTSSGGYNSGFRTSLGSFATDGQGKAFLVGKGSGGVFRQVFEIEKGAARMLAIPPGGASGSEYYWTPGAEYLVEVRSSVGIYLYKRQGPALELTQEILDSSVRTYQPSEAWSVNGDYLVVKLNAAPYFRVYKRTAGALAPLAVPGETPTAEVYSFSWSPTGNLLSFGCTVAPHLFVYAIVNDSLTKIANPTTLPGSSVWVTAWSPDGQKVAVFKQSWGGSCVYSFDGSSLVAMAGPVDLVGSFTNMRISWSTDSQFVAVLGAITAANRYIYRVGATTYESVSVGSGGSAITSSGTLMGALSWRPGKHEFVNTGDQYGGVWRLNAAGTAFEYIEPLDVCSAAYESLAFWIDAETLVRTNWGDGVSTNSDAIAIMEYSFSPIATKVKLETPPAVGAAVTAAYSVNGIHKTDQFVVDVSFAIQFGEPV